MKSIREVCRYDVVTRKGRRMGRVAEVLFHPERSEVVGYTVVRPRVLGVFAIRNNWYLARDRAHLVDGELVIDSGRDVWNAGAAKRLGFSWDDAIIWEGMPLRTESGESLGAVRDVTFDLETGALGALGRSAGIAADLAVGVADFSAELVRGFDGEAVVVADEVARVETDGGAAAAAGRASAVAVQAGGEAAQAAVKAAATAAVYGKAAVKAAAKTQTGKKAMGWLKAIKDEVVDAMGEPEDDK